MRLLDKGAVPDKTIFGEFVLLLAVSFDKKRVVECLIDYGVDLNARNSDGKNAIELAQYFGQEAIVRLLIICKAGSSYSLQLIQAVDAQNLKRVKNLLGREVNIDTVNPGFPDTHNELGGAISRLL